MAFVFCLFVRSFYFVCLFIRSIVLLCLFVCLFVRLFYFCVGGSHNSSAGMQ